jgi:hypothetical protein
MDLALATNELLVGAFVLPLVLALIMQAGWSQPVRAAVFALASVGTAALMHWQDWNDTKSLAQSVVLVLISAGTLYKTFWKPTGIAPVIEAATTLNRTT